MNNQKFSTLSLSKSMIDNLNKLGYKEMTAIQAKALPYILENKDLVAQAKTGSGKTAAFGIGLLKKLDINNKNIQSLILCPTRELADQIAKELRRIARFKGNIKILILSGGIPFKPQVDSLRHSAHIIVGTPGRVLKHITHGSLNLENIETLVLDEAHRMLDMGFIEEIKEVITNIPRKRQTLLFSATYPEEMLKLSSIIQKNAINVKTNSIESENKITEYFYKVPFKSKLNAIIKVLSTHKPENVIIFSNTKAQVKDIAKFLVKRDIDALAIHGDLEQYKRTDVLVQFANKSCSVMVATDVAARGLDIKELDMVINYDIPEDEDTYIHRIGRTARAGKEGKAFTFHTEHETFKISEYENKTRIFTDTSSLKMDNKYSLQAPNYTLVIEGGKKDKIRPGDILGALTKEAGIEGKYIGKIAIYDRQSFVAISREIINEAHSSLKKGKIKGKRFPIWILGL